MKNNMKEQGMAEEENTASLPWVVRDEEGTILSRHASGNDAIDAMCEYPEGRKLDLVMLVDAAEWDWLQDLLAEDEDEDEDEQP